jgi:hypothetical protein
MATSLVCLAASGTESPGDLSALHRLPKGLRQWAGNVTRNEWFRPFPEPQRGTLAIACIWLYKQLRAAPLPRRFPVMFLILAILLFAVIFGVIGFSVHFLWVVAAVILVVWLVGFVARSGSGRWYRW